MRRNQLLFNLMYFQYFSIFAAFKTSFWNDIKTPLAKFWFLACGASSLLKSFSIKKQKGCFNTKSYFGCFSRSFSAVSFFFSEYVWPKALSLLVCTKIRNFCSLRLQFLQPKSFSSACVLPTVKVDFLWWNESRSRLSDCRNFKLSLSIMCTFVISLLKKTFNMNFSFLLSFCNHTHDDLSLLPYVSITLLNVSYS